MREITSSMSKRSSSQFPIIPPLPSSTVLGKENGFETPFRSIDSKSKRTPSTSTRLPLRENNMQKDNYMSPGLMSSSECKDRVLRTAETVDSLFCLSSRSSEEHRYLCTKIADGIFADDANKWSRAVGKSLEEVVASQDSSNPISISHLIRLLRRAKSRFSIIDHKSKETEKDVLYIWLSYAEVLGKYVSSDEARGIYRFIQNQGFDAEKSELYPTLAKFDLSSKKRNAPECMNSGIGQRGKHLFDRHESPARLSLTVKPTTSPVRSPLLDEKKRSSLVPPLPLTSATGHKRSQTQGVSPKRQKRLVEKPHDLAKCKNSTFDLDSRILKGPSDGKNNDRPPVSSKKDQAVSNSSAKDPILRQKKKQQALLSNQRKSSLLPTKSRLKSAALSGGAKRLTPEDSVAIDESDDEKMEIIVSEKNNVNDHVLLESSDNAARKITKLDLSYMMNWDPTKRGSFSISTDCDKLADSNKPVNMTGTALKESTSNLVTTASHVTSSTSSSHTGRSANSNESRDSDTTGRASNNRKASEGSNPVPSPAESLLIAKCNAEFLPLVQEKNILRVNAASYLKLGVMGKGGSSKVYRALAKDYSVVAIKKVKIANLDKKAIDGYANEIALLKKLRGNPAIIQMHDSDVDMKRKAIFLVMEIGEVDLNNVLQQKVLQSNYGSGKGEPKLNINFIRLTWQQMLSAVHSIHEERIIHGDLKPANFLFVRGTLKLIDFGIAKAIQSEDTTNIYRDSQIGTLNYMSPEAILDTGSESGEARMKIGRASDIWSLGCILYQMLFGRTPFASLHMIQKLQAIVNPAHKIDFSGDADEAAVDAVKKCLRRTPENRPPIIGKNGLLNEHYFLNYRLNHAS